MHNEDLIMRKYSKEVNRVGLCIYTKDSIGVCIMGMM